MAIRDLADGFLALLHVAADVLPRGSDLSSYPLLSQRWAVGVVGNHLVEWHGVACGWCV